jgi:hypothetical protein
MNKTIKGCMGCLGIFIASMVILFVGSYIYYEWIWEEWPVERIERITGAKVPKFAIIERHEGERHFTGDYLDTIRIEFESIPSDELFEKIDSMIASNSTKWEKKIVLTLTPLFGVMGTQLPKVKAKQLMAFL